MEKKYSIVCFGEVLWDLLPSGKVAGGAPMNVAYHAKSLGMNAQMISALGADELGKELMKFLVEKQIDTALVQTNREYPTSTVPVTLSETGSATYEIVKPVAWDFIRPDSAQEEAVSRSDVLLFGSLVCRSEGSYQTLLHLIDMAKLIVFDVNLRPPHYSQELLEALLGKAHIVKMNDEELDIISGWYGVQDDIEKQMRFLQNKFNIQTLVMTQGKHGAFCRSHEKLFAQKSFPVQVQDTVGSGDSFLAAFIINMLKGNSYQDCLEFACATGALVATKSGGTPEIDENMVKDFIESSKSQQ